MSDLAHSNVCESVMSEARKMQGIQGSIGEGCAALFGESH
jgi:hypothetical protein